MDDRPGEFLDGGEGVALRAHEDPEVTSFDSNLCGFVINGHGFDTTLEVERIDQSIEELGDDAGVFRQIDINGFSHGGVFLLGGLGLRTAAAAIGALAIGCWCGRGRVGRRFSWSLGFVAAPTSSTAFLATISSLDLRSGSRRRNTGPDSCLALRLAEQSP
ncbi:unannotated protein [freshwater metagenome]|uniref:Unannotated protein n=1 Tax=freshwater metagenome TaxID=449393 RepID=A0A6J6XCR7_9ZZZZ